MKKLALGDHGPGVIHVRGMLEKLRLLPIGSTTEHPDGPSAVYDDAVADAVRHFQQERGLLTDGAVDEDTYHELSAAQYQLGDRTLRYVPDQMMRGDDVRQLQAQLAELGFHAGNVNGIFAGRTHDSLLQFQRDYGLDADGVCGPHTTRALQNLMPKVTGGSLSMLYSRADRRTTGPQLAGRHIYLDVGPSADGFTWNIAHRIAGLLELLGANTTLDLAHQSTPEPRTAIERAHAANQSRADIFLSLQVAEHESPLAEGAATYYFGSPGHVSLVGREVADYVHREITARTPFADLGVHSRVLEILRHTRMPAVLLELGHQTSGNDREHMTCDDVRHAIGEAIVAGIQRFYLDTPDLYPTGTWRIPVME